MSWRSTAGRAVAVASATGLAVHAAPVVTGIGALRIRIWPRLAGRGDPGHVALTFDDGPDAASTPQFLEALDGLGWRATFFMLGRMARRHPAVAAEAAAAGHEIALHGEEHRSLLLRPPWAAAEDLRRGYDAVTDASGHEPAWFRPPYGLLSAGAVRAAQLLGLPIVLWTAWGRDWRPEATPDSVVDDVMAGSLPGGTVLLHDSDCTSAAGAWRSALGALPALAERFAAAGLTVGPLGAHGL